MKLVPSTAIAPILTVDNVSKSYPTYRSNTARFARWFGLPVTPKSEHWAVRDVSFALKPGESMAIIGANGAGKSTLLKLITGTVHPTRGRVGFAGRVSAMLELGLGFNPELTGRQNTFLAGGLMGLGTTQITELLPGIEAFAEIGRFFDEPLRVYSSGMQARLAFAVATAVRPDILIVDEVLSVGDAYFQHKSFDRIRTFKARGTSLLFVSHSMFDVVSLCEHVLMLEKGQVVKSGPADEVVDFYNAAIAQREASDSRVQQSRDEDGWSVTRSGTGEAKLARLELLDATTRSAVKNVRVGQEVILVATVKLYAFIPRLVLGYMLRDRTGHLVWGTNTWHTKQIIVDLLEGQEVTYELRFTCNIGPGSYSFSPALVSSDTHLENNYDWIDNALVFEVINQDKHVFGGTNWLADRFDITVY